MEPHDALTLLLAPLHVPLLQASQSREHGHLAGLMVRAAGWARGWWPGWPGGVAGQAVRAREVLATDPVSSPRACARKLSSTLVAGARAPAKG